MRIIHLLLRILFHDSSHASIGWALVPGYALGVFPLSSVQWWCALFCLTLFSVNVCTVLLSAVLFFIVSHWTDSIAIGLGDTVLTYNSLLTLWARLYHAPIIPYTLFNHTVVMGYILFGFGLPPLCIVFKKFLDANAQSLISWSYSTDFWQSFIASRFYRRFSQYLRYETK